MMYNGFDDNPTDFEKKVSKKQAKWIVIVIVVILISLIIFDLWKNYLQCVFLLVKKLWRLWITILFNTTKEKIVTNNHDKD